MTASPELSEKVLARMNKLLALAMGGVGGEAVTAQRFLDKLLAKHGLTIDDLRSESEAKKKYTMAYTTPFHRRLLQQVLAMVTDGAYDGYWQLTGKKIAVELTASQHAEAVTYHTILGRALTKHMELAYSAFIQRNRVFPATPREGGSDDMSKADLHALSQMMEGTERVEVNKALTKQ